MHHTVLPAALLDVLEDEFRREGSGLDPQPGRVRITDLHILSGPPAAAQ